jgi:hypothetical protein
LHSIMAALLSQGCTEPHKLGAFEGKKRQSRKARNRRTGKKVKVPVTPVVIFKPGWDMEEHVGQLKKMPDGKAWLQWLPWRWTAAWVGSCGRITGVVCYGLPGRS